MLLLNSAVAPARPAAAAPARPAAADPSPSLQAERWVDQIRRNVERSVTTKVQQLPPSPLFPATRALCVL